MEEYSRRPYVKEKQKEHRKRYLSVPENRLKMKENSRRYMKEYIKRPGVKERHQEHHRRGRESGKYTDHGVSLEQRIETMWLQGGLCQICIQPMTLTAHKSNSAQVDHDHKTKVFRGLLCALCNKGLGLFQDDPAVLEGAVQYLRKCA